MRFGSETAFFSKGSKRPGPEGRLTALLLGFESVSPKRETRNRIDQVSAEIVDAIEKHLEGIDRVTQIWETLKKYQPDIEDISLIRQAVLSLVPWRI